MGSGGEEGVFTSVNTNRNTYVGRSGQPFSQRRDKRKKTQERRESWMKSIYAGHRLES